MNTSMVQLGNRASQKNSHDGFCFCFFSLLYSSLGCEFELTGWIRLSETNRIHTAADTPVHVQMILGDSGPGGGLSGLLFRRFPAVVVLAVSLQACSSLPVRETAGLPLAGPEAGIHAVKAGQPALMAGGRDTRIRPNPVVAGWARRAPKAPETSPAAQPADDPAASDTLATGTTPANDPLEPFNRFVFAVNDGLDTLVIKPVAVTYKFWVPEIFRNSIRNVLRNLATPVTLLNDVLQGEMKRAGDTLGRFVLNTTIGFGGLGDPASEFGMPYHYEDFGQTLAVHGAGEGFYLVLPVLGPSSARHTAGRIVDFASDPLTWVLWHKPMEYSLANRGVLLLNNRTELLTRIDGVKESSVDYYATLRSIYRQNRQNEINNGKVEVDALPDISDLE